MRNLVMTMCFVVLFAGVASAVGGGPGGYVYYEAAYPHADSGGAIQYIEVYQLTLDNGWNVAAGPTALANIQFTDSNFASWSGATYGRGRLEVMDPRDQGGNGIVVVPTIWDDQPANGYGTDQPWHLATLDPSDLSQAKVMEGRIYQSGSNPNSENLYKFVPMPQDWYPGTTSNGLSFLVNSQFRVSYMHDENGNGMIDNTTSEMQYVGSMDQAYDMEYAAGEDAIYYVDKNSSPTRYSIDRCYLDGGNVWRQQLYFDVGGAGNPAADDQFGGYGLAVGPGATPVVYYFAKDAAGLANIVALRDTSGDNVITIGVDTAVEIWASGDYGITLSGNYAEDLELYINPDNGAMTLFGNGYYGVLFALELTDNGLQSVDGKVVLSDNTAWGLLKTGAGFELDMDPVGGTVIPEPGTMLLLGTAVLGAIGFVRRRRMQA